MTMRTGRDRERDALATLLCLGDPAPSGSGPEPAELARMRRAILAEAVAHRPRLAFAPAHALTAAAIAVVALMASLIGFDRRDDVPALEHARVARESVAARSAATTDRPAAVALPPAPAVTAPPRVVALARPQAQAAREPATAHTTPRSTTVRFTTQRGTQIIWTLDPRVEL